MRNSAHAFESNNLVVDRVSLWRSSGVEYIGLSSVPERMVVYATYIAIPVKNR